MYDNDGTKIEWYRKELKRYNDDDEKNEGEEKIKTNRYGGKTIRQRDVYETYQAFLRDKDVHLLHHNSLISTMIQRNYGQHIMDMNHNREKKGVRRKERNHNNNNNENYPTKKHRKC